MIILETDTGFITNSISCHGINWLLQRKSFKKMHSLLSTPTQAKLPVAGLQNVSYIVVSGLSKKVLAQFEFPVIITFLFFPLPLDNNSFTAALKNCGDIELFLRTSIAHTSHSPLPLCNIKANIQGTITLKYSNIWTLFFRKIRQLKQSKKLGEHSKSTKGLRTRRSHDYMYPLVITR